MLILCIQGLPDLVIFVEADPGAYQLSGAVVGTNADIEISQGDVLAFKLNAKGHPFWIKTKQGTGKKIATELYDDDANADKSESLIFGK